MDDMKFPTQMIWNTEDAHKAVQEYIQTLLDKIEELETEIKEITPHDNEY